MRNSWRVVSVLMAVGGVSAIASTARATNYTIDWMSLSPVGTGNTIFTPQTFNLPGYGSVRVTITSPLNHTRADSAAFQNGSVAPGADVYSWGAVSNIQQVNFGGTGTSVTFDAQFDFLSGPVPAGRLAFGASGLGRIDLVSPGNITTFTVDKNGTFLGDYENGNAFAPNEFIPGVGSFTMRNSLPGDLTPGSPAFNSKLGVVRIDDGLSTLHMSAVQIGQDGTGFNVGWITPTPGAGVLLGVAGVFAARRRRQG